MNNKGYNKMKINTTNKTVTITGSITSLVRAHLVRLENIGYTVLVVV